MATLGNFCSIYDIFSVICHIFVNFYAKKSWGAEGFSDKWERETLKMVTLFFDDLIKGENIFMCWIMGKLLVEKEMEIWALMWPCTLACPSIYEQMASFFMTIILLRIILKGKHVSVQDLNFFFAPFMIFISFSVFCCNNYASTIPCLTLLCLKDLLNKRIKS